MTACVTHLLTETDSFSDTHGAALQRWVANVLRFDEDPAIVACARHDQSWGLGQVYICTLPGLWAYSKVRGRYRLPWSMRKRLLRRVLRPAIQSLKPGAVVWIHNRPDYAAAIEADVRDAGAKLVVHLHNSLLSSFPPCITASFRADHLVFCSRYLEQEAQQAFPELSRTSVIHNGADESRFFPDCSSRRRASTGAPVVLFAGRLVPEKGAHIFIEAMWLLQARGVRVAGRVLGATGFGSRNPRSTYSRNIMRHAPANVRFLGYRSAAALAEEFRNADIFCSPSVWEEPFGLVNVEAMASALPVISTRGGGVPEIFAEGGGLLVERGSVSELADAIERVVRDAALRRRLAVEAYEGFCRNFTWRAVHRRYRQVLAEVNQPPSAGSTLPALEEPVFQFD